MATFRFGRDINLHWNGYDIKGPAGTIFNIPDQLYDEFNGDIAGPEPTLEWIDTNEFLTLKNSVPSGGYVAKVLGTTPVSISTTSNTSTISINSGTAGNGYLLVADGTGGTIWNPASTSGLTSVVGISPISAAITGGTVSVSLAANYQTAGTYASSVSATSPISASLSTAGVLSLSISSSLTSADSATRTRSLVRNSTASTIAKGSFVYIDGSNGTVPTIKNALANADATSARTFGIVENDITTNTNEYVTNQGLITGIDTSGLADGSVLWLSPTIAGAATTTKPAGPNHGVLLGITVKGGSVGNGSIYVFIKNGAELDEIHDVNISGLASGDILIYSSTASVWQNKTLAAAGVQASGTYVNAVVGTSPASVSTASGTSTVSIVAGSINSTHLSAGSVGASQIIDASIGSAELADGAVTTAKINAAAVDTSKISSTFGTAIAAINTVLTANGAGAASFLPISGAVTISAFTASGTWNKPSGSSVHYAFVVGGGSGGQKYGTGGANGGGGGGFAQGWFISANLLSAETITIGTGGTGQNEANTTGSSGGSSSFGTKLSANGGTYVVGSTNYATTVGRVVVATGTSITQTTAFDGQTTSGGVSGATAFFGPAAGGGGTSAQTGNGSRGGRGFGAGAGEGAGATYVAQATGVAGSNATVIGCGGGGGAGGTTTGGAGGNGYLGGGGGGGGRGVTTSGTGGNGGDGYCLVISW